METSRVVPSEGRVGAATKSIRDEGKRRQVQREIGEGIANDLSGCLFSFISMAATRAVSKSRRVSRRIFRVLISGFRDERASGRRAGIQRQPETLHPRIPPNSVN